MCLECSGQGQRAPKAFRKDRQRPRRLHRLWRSQKQKIWLNQELIPRMPAKARSLRHRAVIF